MKKAYRRIFGGALDDVRCTINARSDQRVTESSGALQLAVSARTLIVVAFGVGILTTFLLYGREEAKLSHPLTKLSC